MTGQQSHQEIHNNFRREMHIRAVRGHSGESLDVSTLSHTKLEQGYALLLSQDVKIQ